MTDVQVHPVDERDIAMFARPTYRAVEYTQISEGFYGATAAREILAQDSREAMEWCEQRSAALSARPPSSRAVRLFAAARPTR